MSAPINGRRRSSTASVPMYWNYRFEGPYGRITVTADHELSQDEKDAIQASLGSAIEMKPIDTAALRAVGL